MNWIKKKQFARHRRYNRQWFLVKTKNYTDPILVNFYQSYTKAGSFYIIDQAPHEVRRTIVPYDSILEILPLKDIHLKIDNYLKNAKTIEVEKIVEVEQDVDIQFDQIDIEDFHQMLEDQKMEWLEVNSKYEHRDMVEYSNGVGSVDSMVLKEDGIYYVLRKVKKDGTLYKDSHTSYVELKESEINEKIPDNA